MRIDARGVALIYPTRSGPPVTALDNLDLTLQTGNLTGVLGPSGSGKSSLLYLLSGLKKPSAGSVFFDDRDTALLAEADLEQVRRQKFGFIFQRHYLLAHLTLLENILLPLNDLSPQAKTRALDLMRILRLSVPPGRYPHELSVGQRQLAAVARALIHDPEVIFADEPTAALDMDTALDVMDTLAAYRERAAIIVVTHDFKILRQATGIIRLRDGRRIE